MKNIIISFAADSSFKEKIGRILTEERINAIGKHSLLSAIICDILSSRVSQFHRFKEHAFLAGAMHDIGKYLILLMLQEIEIREIKKYTITEDVVKKYLREEHSRVGALLTKLWGFSEPVVEAIHNHHAVTKEIGHFSVVKCADTIAHRIKKDMSDEDIACIAEVFKGFDIRYSMEDIKNLLDYLKMAILNIKPSQQQEEGAISSESYIPPIFTEVRKTAEEAEKPLTTAVEKSEEPPSKPAVEEKAIGKKIKKKGKWREKINSLLRNYTWMLIALILSICGALLVTLYLTSSIFRGMHNIK